jgi:hypothetical protein
MRIDDLARRRERADRRGGRRARIARSPATVIAGQHRESSVIVVRSSPEKCLSGRHPK